MSAEDSSDISIDISNQGTIENENGNESVKDAKNVDDATMNTGRTRSEGLGLLLADVLAGPEADRRMWIRYADDPGALAASERDGFEVRLAGDPGLRDRLAVLHGFDPRGSDTWGVDDSDGVVTPMVSRRRTAWIPWIGAAAAAGLATLAMLPLLGDGDAAPASTTRSTREIAVAPRPNDVVALQVAIEHPVPHGSEPIAVVGSETRSATPTAPEASAIAAIEPPAPVAEKEQTPPALPSPAPLATDEPVVLLAAHFEPVSYRAPADFLAREVPSAIVRGTSSGPAIVAWVPDHVAHTSTPQPTLYWSLDGSLPDGHAVGLVVTAESASEPLYEGEQIVDPARSWQHTDLSTLGISLDSGEVYRWSVFLRADGEDPSADRIAQGWIEYRAPSGGHADALAGAVVGSRAARFAERGYWYDALTVLVDFAATHPEDRDARERLAGFLAEAGIQTATR